MPVSVIKVVTRDHFHTGTIISVLVCMAKCETDSCYPGLYQLHFTWKRLITSGRDRGSWNLSLLVGMKLNFLVSGKLRTSEFWLIVEIKTTKVGHETIFFTQASPLNETNRFLEAAAENHDDSRLSKCFPPLQGKFIRCHFSQTGKLAGADIESCKYPAP